MSFIRRLILCSNQSFPSVTVRRTRLVHQAWKHSQTETGCRDARVPNHKVFYNSPLSGQNITSKVTLNDGVAIPIYGLGVYQAGPGEETRNVVLWALEKGYRQIDTASRYKNEDSVGEALREANLTRDELFVVTKLYDDDHGYDETLTAFNKSLERLGLDFVDLYLIHSPLPDRVVPSWNAMIKLRQQGLIRSIGVSNFGIHHLEALKQHSTVKPAVNQIEVHPFLQERELVQYCEKEGIAVQAYSPLTRGEKLNHPTLKAVGDKYNKTPAQILLRWCIQKRFICIPKSSHLSRIKENADIFDFTISKEDMDILDGLNEGFRTGRPKILQPWTG